MCFLGLLLILKCLDKTVVEIMIKKKNSLLCLVNMFFVRGLIIKLLKRTLYIYWQNIVVLEVWLHNKINNPCTLIKVFHCPIKLFVISSHTKSIHEGYCDPWITKRGTISGKKLSGMKLELRSYSEKTLSSCDHLLI